MHASQSLANTDVIERRVVLHALAALGYRTQKAVRGAPTAFDAFAIGQGARTPAEIVRHMTSVLGYARTFFIGGIYRIEPLATLEDEVQRFHEVLSDLGAHLRAGTPLREISLMQLLQGPISDAMTHAGQLAMLRRLAGSPVPSENFIFAEVSSDTLGADQPLPAAPDSPWMGKVVHYGWKLIRMLRGFR